MNLEDAISGLITREGRELAIITAAKANLLINDDLIRTAVYKSINDNSGGTKFEEAEQIAQRSGNERLLQEVYELAYNHWKNSPCKDILYHYAVLTERKVEAWKLARKFLRDKNVWFADKIGRKRLAKKFRLEQVKEVIESVKDSESNKTASFNSFDYAIEITEKYLHDPNLIERIKEARIRFLRNQFDGYNKGNYNHQYGIETFVEKAYEHMPEDERLQHLKKYPDYALKYAEEIKDERGIQIFSRILLRNTISVSDTNDYGFWFQKENCEYAVSIGYPYIASRFLFNAIKSEDGDDFYNTRLINSVLGLALDKKRHKLAQKVYLAAIDYLESKHRYDDAVSISLKMQDFGKAIINYERMGDWKAAALLCDKIADKRAGIYHTLGEAI